MKKIILFLYMFFCLVILQAQVVITNNDIAGPGATILQSLDESPEMSIVPGPGGPNQTWDFSGLLEDTLDTMRFMNPDWTPYAGFFPNANFTMQMMQDDMYLMMHRDADAFTMVGMVGTFQGMSDTTIMVWVDPPQVIADFPVEYLDTRIDTTVYEIKMSSPVPPADSIKVKITIASQVAIDSWGILTIPMGTFDVLRVYEVRTTIDSIFTLLFGQWILSQSNTEVTDVYSWWTDDEAAGFYLAEMTAKSKDKGPVIQVKYLKQSPTFGIEDQQVSYSAIAYPNPATSYIVIRPDRDFQGTIEVLDILGNIHAIISNAGPCEHRIDLRNMHSGLFVYRLTDIKTGRILTGRFIIR